MDHQQAVSLYQVLTDKTRLQILQMLQAGECCACELLKNLSISQSTLSHHMKCLTESGLVKGRKNGRWIHYSLNPIRAQELSLFTQALLFPQDQEI
ncbi:MULTISPECIES: ArsR/SmtB family transcription factor [unclassified Acinetobacter]|uniref:ArsR/SmtB family transcription factor n=1 Tax=unclassified Acinetobacter TaxID=196816 RepID=UPI000A33F864|nr:MULTISPECIES: metalloregulator ArsR/SmtB family transcription factor [unclassified Acinetobacter]OTG70358.1 transcriptional regulator [Acinetobacter sp. ANC 4218]